MSVYYNEFDPKAAEWLRELMKSGLIAEGVVDERSITDVRPSDLAGFDQCHFFAGIGGWSLALRLAGIPDDFRVWTGSCPCQPFSAAGKRMGKDDERHLWPDFRNLIGECAPPAVFGEQVASKDGREWLAGVSADMEALAYRFAAADLCAAGVGAPHIRQRLFWVADANCCESGGYNRETCGTREEVRIWTGSNFDDGRATCGLADAEHAERRAERQEHGQPHGRNGSGRRGIAGVGRLADRGVAGLEGFWRAVEVDVSQGWQGAQRHSCAGGFWSDFDIIPCRDGKARRIESGTFPLAHGVSGRVGLLRGYGNAIVPQVAARFIEAWLEAREEISRA